jgi:hypothetical protein
LSDARLPVGCTWRAFSAENSRGLNAISLATRLPPALFGFAQTTSMGTDASGAPRVTRWSRAEWFYRATTPLALWRWFLWRVSRLKLQLIPGHPDHDGGLGPLEGVHERFTPFIAAVSILQCASLAESISTRAVVPSVAVYPWVAMVLLVDVALFICPLLVFTDKL